MIVVHSTLWSLPLSITISVLPTSAGFIYLALVTPRRYALHAGAVIAGLGGIITIGTLVMAMWPRPVQDNSAVELFVMGVVSIGVMCITLFLGAVVGKVCGWLLLKSGLL